ncbi:hypothetical protein [Pseudofrankia inefficax]|uniref:Uncharacterized protein n=1 Tax=Pseudofrankia inefficax (strain DSM 45817 / CECT 9037 / DDB 130130 / EuI1c) TaxID=298654 RepID=E3IW83_PSEI1|nr:hypothetical protein [Pseudofrankia inefficax]ADP78925.1 hypothetical protein FraEuI1c_0847 [Pseudofrankia inefficax]
MNAPRRVALLVLSCYPPSFRERYGAEVRGLLEDTEVRTRTVLDLIVNGARAWSRAVVATDGTERVRRRLQATIATTWVCWCAGFLVTPAVNRALLDPEPAHVPSGVIPLLNTSLVAIAVSAALILIASIPLLRVFLLAARRGEWPIVRPLLIAAVAVVVDLLGLAGLVAWRRTYPPIAQNPHFSGLFVGALVVWTLGFVCALVAAGVGPALATTRAAPPASALRLPGLLAVPVAALLIVATAASTAAVVLMLRTAHGEGVGVVGLAFVGLALVTAIGASAGALTTACRGLRPALRAYGAS